MKFVEKVFGLTIYKTHLLGLKIYLSVLFTPIWSTQSFQIHSNFASFTGADNRLLQVQINVKISNQQYRYNHPPLSAVNWFQKNRALTELHRKANVQKLQSATQYCITVDLGKSAIAKQR
jgi:hypothetical protein